MKKLLLVLILMVFIASMVFFGAGCKESTTAETTAVASTATETTASATTVATGTTAASATMSFWMIKTFSETANAAVEARVKDFEKQYNATVDLRMIAIDDFVPQWSAAIESGNVPDLSYCGYEDAGKFYSLSVLMDLSDLVTQLQKDNGTMDKALIRGMTIEGKQWGVPMWAEPTVLYYRKDIFKKAGINTPPETWDEFLQNAEKTTDVAAGIYGAGIGLGRDDSDSEWWMRDIIWSFGASLFSEDGKSSVIDSSEGKQAFTWIKDFFTTAKVTPPGVIGWDDGGNNAAWLAGQVAMVINTGSIYNKMVSEKIDLLDQTGIALVPGGPKGRFITGLLNGLCIFNKAKNPDTAKKLISFLGDKNWQKEWMKAGGYLIIPPYTDLSQDAFWQTEAGNVFSATPQYYAFLGYPGPYTPAAGEVTTTRMLTDAIEKVVVQNQPIDEVLKTLQADINTIINK